MATCRSCVQDPAPPAEQSAPIERAFPPRRHDNFDSLGYLMERFFKAASEGVDPAVIEQRQREYDGYLQSQSWFKTRSRIILRAAGRCERCHTANTLLEVHHLTYARRGHELYTDLVAVCPTCHNDLHRNG